MKFLDPNLIHQKAIPLGEGGDGPEQFHLFDEASIAAINAALAARRPLLVRGEPGVGKTQLAMAAARQLGRPLDAMTVDSRTESRDLLWQFDAVRRLAQAQLCGILKDTAVAEQLLREPRFVTPGPLWWGFDWDDANRHGKDELEAPPRVAPVGTDPSNGRVVLIDEIDKADSDVPNGLLEALGARRFTPPGCPTVVAKGPPPLVIITTNEERVLPDAFVRRCLVLHLALPTERNELVQRLVERGIAHFGAARASLLKTAAEQLAVDREKSLPPRPGQAEYLDLVRAVLELAEAQKCAPESLLESVGRFTLCKQTGGRK